MESRQSVGGLGQDGGAGVGRLAGWEQAGGSVGGPGGGGLGAAAGAGCGLGRGQGGALGRDARGSAAGDSGVSPELERARRLPEEFA